MIAILLSAGFATRMYPITKNCPKALLVIAGKPVLDYLMHQLVLLPELDSIFVVTNELFYEEFSDWEKRWSNELEKSGIKIQIINDSATTNDNRLGAIGDMALVLKSLKFKEPTIVAACDNIYLFSLRQVTDVFINGGSNIVIALRETTDKKRGKKGLIEIGKDGRVLRLFEKTTFRSSGWFCPPIYFLQPTALRLVDEYLDGPDSGDSPGHFISYLVEREPVYAIKIKDMRLDIGTIESYEYARRILSKEPVIIS